MPNFLTYSKKYNPNMYSLLVSFFLALWYNGISGLLNYYWPNRGPALSVIFLLIPLLIFLTDDGHLDELYRAPIDSKSNVNVNENTNANVIVASNPQDTFIKRNGFSN